MKLIIEDSEIDEKPILIKSEDRGKIIVPSIGERGKGLDELRKEIIAHDTIEVGPTRAAEIHGITTESAFRYGNGEQIKDEDAKTRILSRKHGIGELAVTKLMQTLNMFDPNGLENQKDIVRAAKDLSSIAESMTPSSKNSGDGEIHLHMYAPKQRPMREFEVIDV